MQSHSDTVISRDGLVSFLVTWTHSTITFPLIQGVNPCHWSRLMNTKNGTSSVPTISYSVPSQVTVLHYTVYCHHQWPHMMWWWLIVIERDGHVHQMGHQLGNFNGTESEVHTNVCYKHYIWLLISPMIFSLFCRNYFRDYSNFYSLLLIFIRFGHASVQISSDTLLMYGGFGSTGPNLSQSRLKSLISVDLHTQTVTQVSTEGDRLPGICTQ